MPIRNERRVAALTAGRFLLLSLLLCGWTPNLSPVWAQEALEPVVEDAAVADGETAADAPSTADLDELGDDLLERYRALPARDGILLVPRDEVPGISSIEVADGEVAVNGETVSAAILASWLGDEAAPLLALAALDTEAARQLLAVDATAAAGDPSPMAVRDADSEEEEDRPRRREREGDDRSVRLGQQFKIGGDIIIEENEIATEAVAIGGSVVVRGRVLRDIVAIGGSVEVEGEVGGEIVGILGGVILGPDSHVDGNITAVGSGVRRSPGARVGGQVTEAAVPGVAGNIDLGEWVDGRRHRSTDWVREWKANEAYWNLVGTVLLALMACLALLIGRRTVEGVERRIANGSDLLVAGLVGVAVQLLLVPALIIVTVLLVLTIVGCLALPLIPFLVLALVIAALFGYAGVALRLGRWLERRFGWRLESPYVAVLLGVALIEIWKLTGEALDIFGGPAWFFAAMFLFVGVVVEYAAWSVGLGAILMNWTQGRRDRRLPPPPPGTLPAGTPPPGGPPPGEVPPPLVAATDVSSGYEAGDSAPTPPAAPRDDRE